MFAPYGYVDSYPQTSSHHRDHIPYTYPYYPSWEAVSPQITVDTQRPPSSFRPWSSHGSHTHPTLVDPSSCCNHGCHPGYFAFRAPCPHTPPPFTPQPYCQGPHPPSYGSYPSFVIPPFYPADQNPHGCSISRAHHCDCSNHACNRGDRNRVKIEEQKSERDPDDGSSKLIQPPNYPYPVVWIPPGYLKEKETNKSSEAAPAVWNGWFPMSISNHSGRKLHEDGKNNLQTKEKKNQIPWPIIWMPGDEKSEDSVKDLKEISSDPKVEEKLPSNLRIIPLKLLENGSHGEKPGDVDGKHKTEAVAEKECRTRTIPVRQIEEDKHEKPSIDEKHKDKDDEKLIGIRETKKENGAKKTANGTSKLPPVCLRVDPLPRKKTANGTSRSSSPTSPSDKEKSCKDKTGKERLIVRDKEEMPKKEIKVIHVSDEAEKSKKKMQDTEATASNKEAAKVVEIQVDKDDKKQPMDKAPGGHVENIERTISKPAKERKILSEFDAATIIQSAYRGLEVRRWQPLEKLRKISQIRQKAEAFKKQIQELEAASKCLDLKQKTVISETIMNLLLQLDTIQGLHPSLRDVRKSLARELVTLQEKLDSMGAAALTEHEEIKAEHCPSVAEPGDTAISAPAANESVTAESEHGPSQLTDATHSLEESSVDGKEAAVEQPRDVEVVVMAESADSSTGTDNLTSLHGDKDSILYSAPLGGSAESQLMEKDQPHDLEEVTEPLASASQGVSKADKQLEDTASVHRVGDELSDPEAASATKHDEVGLEKSFALCTEVEAKEMTTEEAKPEMEELVQPTPRTMGAEVVSSVKETILPCDEVDSMKAAQIPAVESNPDQEAVTSVKETSLSCDEVDSMKAAQVPAVESSNPDQEAVADKDAAAHAIEDIQCSEQAIHAMKPEALEEACQEEDIPCSAIHAIKPEALESCREDGMSPMLMAGSVDIVKDESYPSDRTTEGISKNQDCAAPELLPDALEIQKDGCITMDEAFEINAAAEETENHVVPCDDTPRSMNTEAKVAEPNTLASGQQECSAYADETAKLDAGPPSVTLSNEEKKLVEENEKLREMLEKLLQAGNAQMGIIAELNGRVKDLEKRMSQKKRCKVKSLRARKNCTTPLRV